MKNLGVSNYNAIEKLQHFGQIEKAGKSGAWGNSYKDRSNRFKPIDGGGRYSPSAAVSNRMAQVEHAIDLDAMFKKHGYQLGDKLGKGSFAVVKKALHIASGREMAVKIVDHNLATKEFLEKFLSRELNIIRTLKHPNIIDVEKIVRIGPYTCVIMEQAKKGDLLECVLRRGFLAEKESKKILLGVVRALQFCHSNNIAHRDLKCENILLDENGDAKLSDFGFARCVIDQTTQETIIESNLLWQCGLRGSRSVERNTIQSDDVWCLELGSYTIHCGNWVDAFRRFKPSKDGANSGEEEVVFPEQQTRSIIQQLSEPYQANVGAWYHSPNHNQSIDGPRLV